MSGVLYSHVTTTVTIYGCDLKIVCATIPCAVCAHKYRCWGVGRGRDCRVCVCVCVIVYTLLPANMNTK